MKRHAEQPIQLNNWYYEVCLKCEKCVLGGLRPGRHEDCETSKWFVCWQCNFVTAWSTSVFTKHKGHKLLPENQVAIQAGRRMAMQAAKKAYQKKMEAAEFSGHVSQVIRGVLAQNTGSDHDDDEFVDSRASSSSKGTTRPGNSAGGGRSKEEEVASTEQLPNLPEIDIDAVLQEDGVADAALVGLPPTKKKRAPQIASKQLKLDDCYELLEEASEEDWLTNVETASLPVAAASIGLPDVPAASTGLPVTITDLPVAPAASTGLPVAAAEATPAASTGRVATAATEAALDAHADLFIKAAEDVLAGIESAAAAEVQPVVVLPPAAEVQVNGAVAEPWNPGAPASGFCLHLPPVTGHGYMVVLENNKITVTPLLA